MLTLIQNILLVGGLGNSPYVYDTLNLIFPGAVLRPRNGWTAVARGAVIRLVPDALSSKPTPAENQGTPLSQPELSTTIVAQVDQNDAQQMVVKQEKIIKELREDLRKAKNELVAAQQEHDSQLAELKKALATMRAEGTKSATPSTKSPLQLPLQCSEYEIKQAWRALIYDVEKLVSKHFGESGGDSRAAWADREAERLKQLTPYYNDLVKEKRTAIAFIEAAIWNELCLRVFGPYRTNAPFCWAGKYKESLETMSSFLIADIDRLKLNKQKVMCHRWKALTANLVATIVSRERHGSEKDKITEDLEEMLNGLSSQNDLPGADLEEILDGLSSPTISQARLSDLRVIVDKAVDLAAQLCGQKELYCVGQFPEKCYEVDLDHDSMELMVESPRSKRVKFMVRPGLYATQEENYDTVYVLGALPRLGAVI
ncbi:hypothetical protein NW754_000604 [Fusarium falciforme]|nr:hypothetical protein NW754_000604 [Fusarium falciforme]